jgi:hypothetical protein
MSSSIKGLVVLFAVPEVIGKHHRYAITTSKEEHFFWILIMIGKARPEIEPKPCESKKQALLAMPVRIVARMS